MRWRRSGPPPPSGGVGGGAGAGGVVPAGVGYVLTRCVRRLTHGLAPDELREHPLPQQRPRDHRTTLGRAR
ncbi:hypothetical protein, partial [Nocardia abscessus]|uniref:hypothetical protein n=1 Tax=Nocardia abscessus TaxID=120957 RepID=UPI0024558AAF